MSSLFCLTDADRVRLVNEALAEFETEAADLAANRHNLGSPVADWRPDAENRLPVARITALAVPWHQITEGVSIGGAAETFWPYAFRRSVAAGGEITIDVDHRKETTFAWRSRGQVEVWEDPTGLWLRCLIPGTTKGRAALAFIEHGRAGGLSISFARDPRYVVARTHTAICCVIEATLLGVSLASKPAYSKTAGTLTLERSEK